MVEDGVRAMDKEWKSSGETLEDKETPFGDDTTDYTH